MKSDNDCCTIKRYHIFVIRHGERIDYVDKNWLQKVNHKRYRDPHLAEKGISQCKESAIKISGILESLYNDSESTNEKGALKLSENELTIISSPYLRCVQSSAEIARHLNYNSTIKIEAGICEVLKEYPPQFLDNAAINKDILCKGMVDVTGNYTPVMTRDMFRKKEYGDNPCIRRASKVTARIYERYFKQKGNATNLLLVGHGASCFGMIDYLSGGKGEYVGLCCISHFVVKQEVVTSESNQKKKHTRFVIKSECIGDSSHLSDQTNLRAFWFLIRLLSCFWHKGHFTLRTRQVHILPCTSKKN